jgi:PAS domain S-box-containing protein
LRARLALLVLLALLPAFGLQVATSFERQRNARERAEASLLQVAQLIAGTQRERIESTREVLVTLSHMPELKGDSAQACHERLAMMYEFYPHYTGLAVFGLDGNNICARSAVSTTVNLSDRLYFQRAVATREFAVGEYQIGRVIGRPVLGFAQPIFDDHGQVMRVLITTVELSTLNQIAAGTPLPEQAVLTIVDRNGLIMVRDPGDEEWMGRQLPEAALAGAIISGRSGVVQDASPDGTPMLYAYTPIAGLPNTEMYVGLGLPVAVAYAEAKDLLWRNLAWAAVAALLVLLAASAWSRYSILQPVQALTSTAERLRRGDLAARTGVAGQADELGRLAASFDEMASALAARDAALQAERQWLRVTLAGIGDAVIATDTNGRIVFMNPVAQNLSGWPEAAASGQAIDTVFRVINEQTRAPVDNPVARVLRDGVIVGLANHSLLITRDGREVPIDDSGAPIRDEHGNLLGVVLVFRDVTARRQAEAELYAAKQLLDRTFTSLDQAVFVVDPHTRTIISANPAVERVFGYRIDDVVGRSTEMLNVDREHFDTLGQQMFTALDQTGVFHTESDMRRNDGTLFPAEVTVTEFRDESGQRAGVVGVVRDITERRQAETALHAARREAERAADRITRLQRVTAALARAVMPVEVFQAAVREGAAVLGAAAGGISVVSSDGAWLEVAHFQGAKHTRFNGGRRLPLDAATPDTDAARSGQAVWLESRDEWMARYPATASAGEAVPFQSAAAVPLVAHEAVLGVLALSFSEARRFSGEERDFLSALAVHCAQALERTQLYEAERDARLAAEQAARRTAGLQSVTAGLSRALSPDEVAGVVIAQGVDLLGAQAGLLVIAGDDGRLHVQRSSGYPKDYLEQFFPMPADSALASAEVARSGEPVWLQSQAAAAERYPSLARARAPHALEALAVVPLRFEGRVLGVLGLSFDTEQVFEQADRALLMALAGAAAQALERARLYVEAQRLNAELEERVQARTEQLKVAVEDLRMANVELERQVSERRRAEDVLRRSERRLAEAQHLARLGSWHWDMASGKLTWSDELYRICGLQPGEFGGTLEAFLECVHPEDRGRVRESLDRAVEEQLPFSFDHRIVRPDGEVRTLQARGEVIVDGGGQPAALSGTGQDITERKAIEDELRHSRELLMHEVAARQRALRQLEDWREDERSRIAREVHDELGGALTALKMGLRRARRVEHMPAAGQALLDELAAEIDATAMIVRRIAHELRPAVLDDFGLLSALEWQYSEFLKRSGLQGEWQCEVEELPLPDKAAIACFRIVQEALTNVARHAQASRVSLAIRREGGQFVIRVADDGRGMAEDGEQPAQAGLGLVGMHERAVLLSGELRIDSLPGKGTIITLRVPATGPG